MFANRIPVDSDLSSRSLELLLSLAAIVVGRLMELPVQWQVVDCWQLMLLRLGCFVCLEYLLADWLAGSLMTLKQGLVGFAEGRLIALVLPVHPSFRCQGPARCVLNHWGCPLRALHH